MLKERLDCLQEASQVLYEVCSRMTLQAPLNANSPC